MNHGPQVIGLYDPAFIDAVNPFRVKLGLPLLKANQPADFSGDWLLIEDKSMLNNSPGGLPHKLKVYQDENQISIKKAFIEEWTDDRTSEEKISLDGKENKSETFGSENILTASLSANKDTLTIKAKISFKNGMQTAQRNTTENWWLQNAGSVLTIQQSVISLNGERRTIMVYEKE